MEDSEGFERIQEVKSFKKRQEVPRKRFWMSEVSGGLENVWKLQNGAGRLRRFGRVLSSETRKVQESYEEEFHQVEGARRSRYSNCRMYMKEASFIL